MTEPETVADPPRVETKGASTGSSINLRSFKADDATGAIPEQTATVNVTYTHPDGTAKASKSVKIHKIDFVVTQKKINKGYIEAIESPLSVLLRYSADAEISTDPKVEIRLDASCPRKAQCAGSHRVGWLQTMLTNRRETRFSHTLASVVAPMPIRDVWNATEFPFYSTVTVFAGDKDKQIAHHEDNPSYPARPGAPWTDPRAGANPPPGPPPATNLQLRRLTLANSFTAWLVVQNTEWAAHDVPGSFAYQGHFDWSVELDATVDTTQPVGSRVAPSIRRSTAPDQIQSGKGSGTPNLALPFFNTAGVIKVDPAPGI